MSDPGIVERYRHLRRIAGTIQEEALGLVPQAGMVEFGRRLGAVWQGRLALDDDADRQLVYEFAIHTGKQGRSRAIDRYAHKASFAPGSDEARVLRALCDAFFTLLVVEELHPAAGVIARDIARQQDFHLMDVSMGLAAPEGMAFAGRLMEIDGFRMSCMSLVPVTPELLEVVAPRMPPGGSDDQFEYLQDPRCAAAFYRSAFETGVRRRCLSFEVSRELPTLEKVAAIRALSDRPPVDLPALLLGR